MMKFPIINRLFPSYKWKVAAVIIGGVSLFGGRGSIWGAFIGVLFLGVLINAMTLWGFNPYAQQVVRGALILGAVFVNFYIDRK